MNVPGLALIDAKTGPRHVLLGEAARELLNRVAETASGEWVFPGYKGNGPLSTDDLWRFWIKVREAAGIVADARLHDLRHSFASRALALGETLPVIGKLLGHSDMPIWRRTRSMRRRSGSLRALPPIFCSTADPGGNSATAGYRTSCAGTVTVIDVGVPARRKFLR